MAGDRQRIRARLLDLSKHTDPQLCFPTLVPQAAETIRENPYAFCLATCLDRGMKADVVWTIPYWIEGILGHLDARRVYRLPMDRLASLVGQIPKKPRYVQAAPRTIREITAIVVEQFGGDAARIWQSKRAASVTRVFQSVYGVGPGIASMAVQLPERGYGIRFTDLDHRVMDIKPDLHTTRVLYRLGVASSVGEREATHAARSLNSPYAGEPDFPLWVVGRQWCSAMSPQRARCPLEHVCPQLSVSG